MKKRKKQSKQAKKKEAKAKRARQKQPKGKKKAKKNRKAKTKKQKQKTKKRKKKSKAQKKSRKKVFKKTEIQNKFLKRKKKIPQKSIPPFGHVGDFLSFYLSIIVRFVFQNCFAFMPCQVIMGKNPGAPGLQMLHLYSLARVVFAYTRFPWFRNGMCA